MDATISVRDFFKRNGIHDYSLQPKGQLSKVVIRTFLVKRDALVETSASLYRPETKEGDARIWFAGLKRYCQPYNLLALIAIDGCLYVFNMSDAALVEAFPFDGTCPNSLIARCVRDVYAIADELFSKVRLIHDMGFVRGVSHGDTNVGMTLESLLGIPPNTSQQPDFKGIELKASRDAIHNKRHEHKNKRMTLFTQVPDWKRSPFDAKKILNHFGYETNGRLQLYCTVSNIPNPQGLYLETDSLSDDLWNKAITGANSENVAVWALATLRNRLAEKHQETFWIQATSIFKKGVEYFRYDSIRHTRRPNVNILGTLFDAGIISLDYALHKKKSGGVRDHGYLFRTMTNNFKFIFPEERLYSF